MRKRLSYGNVVSSLALFIALGGTSYALTLPRNSVGAKQIRRGAVRSSEVKDRSLGVRDISTTARRTLRGQTGATGTTGPTGPPGASGVTYRAAVSSAGSRIRGNAVTAGTRGMNEFLVAFDRSVDDCVSTATLATVEGGGIVTPPAGRITVAREGGSVLVRTYDAAGSPTKLPFHLIVAC
ncbi:MAG: hypothetical protein ABI611_17695 [Solirubrobacteraceae bacterium]